MTKPSPETMHFAPVRACHGDTCGTAAPAVAFAHAFSPRLRASMVSPGFASKLGEMAVRRLKVKEPQVDDDLRLPARCEGTGYTASEHTVQWSRAREMWCPPPGIKSIMGFFFFDESIHPEGNFALGAFVYSEYQLDTIVAEALTRAGLTPRVDEFKSSSRMDKDLRQACARDELKVVLRENCRIGLVITPDVPRDVLGREAIVGLKKILGSNAFDTATHEVFFDQGLFANKKAGYRSALGCSSKICTFHFEENSRSVLGLQVADLAAHTCSAMLLSQLGLCKKIVKAGHGSGYDPDLDIELDFELWASVRRSFFASSLTLEQFDVEPYVDVAERGLHISEMCSPALQTSALSRFSKMYVGCIH